MGKSRAHYVPRFVLRRFSSGSQDTVHVYDKSEGRSFVASTGKVAAEKGLYDFEFEGAELTLEPGLAEIEGAAAKNFERILRDGYLSASSSTEREELASFFAVQLVRTPAHAAQWRDVMTRMETYVRREGISESFFAFDPRLGSEANAQRAFAARTLVQAPQTFGPSFTCKDFVLMESPGPPWYLIGDHPLVMHNSRDMGPRGNLGLNVEGIEIYFPLSPKLVLGMMCASHRLAFQQGLEQRVTESQRNDPSLQQAFSIARDFLQAVASGRPARMDPLNVVFLNSLQIIRAERFVFSASGDFSLVEEMLRSHPELRTGVRIEEATGKL